MNMDINICDENMNDELRKIKLDELSFNSKTLNGLKRYKIESFYDLYNTKYEEMLRIKYFGLNSYKEIQDKIYEVIEEYKKKKNMSKLYTVNSVLDIFGNVKIESMGFTSKSYSTLKNDNINTLEDMYKERFTEIYMMKDISKRTSDEVKEKINGYEEYLAMGNYRKIEMSEDVLAFYKSVLIKNLFPQYEVNLLKIGIKNLDNLNHIEFFELQQIGITYDDFIVMQNILYKLKSPKSIINSIKLKSTHKEIFNYLIKDKLSLAKCGRIMNLSNERVRQINNKTKEKVIECLGYSEFVWLISLLKDDDLYISCSDLTDCVGIENSVYISFFKEKDCELFLYFEPLDMFFMKSIDDFTEKMKSVIDDLPEQFNIMDHIDKLLEITETFGIRNVEINHIGNLLQKYGYKKYGYYFTRNTLSVINIFEIIMKNYIDEPIKINKEGYEKFRNIAKNMLEFDISKKIKTLETKIREVPNVALVGAKTFIHIDKLKYDMKALELVDNYIDEKKNDRFEINVSEIFQEFEKELISAGIENKYKLYSLISKYYGEKYKIGKSSSLNIYFYKERAADSVVDRLKEYLELVGGISSKNEIQEHFNWSKQKVVNAISNCAFIISIGDEIKLLKETKFNLCKKSKLDKFIEEEVKKGYISVQGALDEMRLDPELSNLIRENEIEDKVHFAYFLKRIYNYLGGNSIVLFDIRQGIDSTDKVIIREFKEQTSREDIIAFMVKVGYSEVTAIAYMYRLIRKDVFRNIHSGCIVLNDKYQ